MDQDTKKAVYVGRPISASDFDAMHIAKREFQIMKVYKNGVFMEYRGGSKIVVTGSILEMIAPESAVWEGTQSVYPFVFTSDSEWTVDVCAEVPTGYSIKGIYDQSGNLIPSVDCAKTFVAGETKIVAFEVQEVGSPEPKLTATLNILHKGKTKKMKVTAYDIRKKTFKATLKEIRK
jgi:hypothetical protein